MLGCGCEYKPYKKTYYNDTHERHDNQLDRVTKATRHAYTSFREEKWWAGDTCVCARVCASVCRLTTPCCHAGIAFPQKRNNDSKKNIRIGHTIDLR